MARRYYNKRDRYGRWAGKGGAGKAANRRRGYAAYQKKQSAINGAVRKKKREANARKAAAVTLLAVGAVAAVKSGSGKVDRAYSGPKNYKSAGDYGTAPIKAYGPQRKYATKPAPRGTKVYKIDTSKYIHLNKRGVPYKNQKTSSKYGDFK